MTKLTTERLERKIKNCIEIEDVQVMLPLSAAEELLAFREAAKNPIGSFHISDGKVEATTDYCRDGEWPVQDGEVMVYAAPVLPKQPELIGMKVSIDTGSDNIGHRLFGEIVGTSDSKGVPVLCIEVAENNADVTLADEGETAKIVKAAEKLVRCKGRYHSEQNYRALAALFGVTVPDLPPLPSDEAPAQPVIPEQQQPIAYIFKHPAGRLFWSLIDESNQGEADVIPVYAEPHELKIPPAIEPDYEVIKGILPTANPDEYACCVAADMWNACCAEMLKAQSVSEHKWMSVTDRLPSEFGRYLCYVEEQNDLGKSHYQWNCSWNGDEFSDAELSGRVTHWMPLPAAPTQESE